MAIKEVDPISRIEGHLGVACDVVGDKVVEANVHGNLWRGFENFLIGREANDAITFTQRICGVCPVPHGQASTFAVDAVLGYNDNFQTWAVGGTYSPSGRSAADIAALGDDRVAVAAGKGIPVKAIHIRNLVLSAEFLMSNITHSYHLAAPSYIQGPNIPPWTPYFDDNFYHPYLQATGKGTGVIATSNLNQPAQPGATLPMDDAGFSKDLWSAVIKQYVKALRIRRLTFEAGGLFAGRMPMTSCYVGGGVTTDKTENLGPKCDMYRAMMQEIGTFIVKEFVPLFLALGVLYPNYDNEDNAAWLNTNAPGLYAAGDQSAVGGAPTLAAKNCGWGAGVGNFLSWGAFPQPDGTLGVGRGYILRAVVDAQGAKSPILAADVLASLREDIKHSRYQGSVTALNPDGTAVVVASDTTNPATEIRTAPERGNAAKYSWLKAPRWAGAPMEVGPMARMYVNGLYKRGATLASTLGAAYMAYVKTAGAVQGLDPAMIEADLAVACVRAGVATLNVGGSTVALPATEAGIVAAYTDPTAVITGPLALWVLNLKAGLSTIDRLRARPLESYVLIQAMIGGFSKASGNVVWNGTGGWIGDLKAATGDTYAAKAPIGNQFGFGATEAPRGALMHMCTTDAAGKIKAYQCIVPTTWNASPKGANDARGPMEQSMIDIDYSPVTTTATGGAGATITAGGGVEALRVAQSFDPCIACAVH